MPLPVTTYTTRSYSSATLAIGAETGVPRTQTCDGGSSMKSPVQSPAREISSRYPVRPGVATVANECHSRSGLRLIPTAEAKAGVTPESNSTIAACAAGGSTLTGTRRSRSHGEATLTVSSASTHTCQAGAARCSVSAQKSPIAVQPPNRCDHSNTLWARLRTAGAAQAQTSTATATTHQASTSVV